MPKAISNTMSKAAGRPSLYMGRPDRNLAFILDLFSIISTKQELDHCADQMVK